MPQITALLFIIIILLLTHNVLHDAFLQEEEASRGVSGYFNVTIGETILQFPADITAEQLETLMSVQFPEEGGMYWHSYKNNFNSVSIVKS